MNSQVTSEFTATASLWHLILTKPTRTPLVYNSLGIYAVLTFFTLMKRRFLFSAV